MGCVLCVVCRVRICILYTRGVFTCLRASYTHGIRQDVLDGIWCVRCEIAEDELTGNRRHTALGYHTVAPCLRFCCCATFYALQTDVGARPPRLGARDDYHLRYTLENIHLCKPTSQRAPSIASNVVLEGRHMAVPDAMNS